MIRDKDTLTRTSDGNVFIAYAKRGTEIRHISEVPRGLACSCHCVECDEPLVARKGDLREEHFAHVRRSECHGGIETVLHRLAKELLPALQLVALPEYRMIRKELVGLSTITYNDVVCPSSELKICNALVEHRLDDVIPDLIISNGADEFLIEIAVTHRVDATKLARLRAHNIPALEIQLTARDAVLSRTELATKLATDLESKRWLFHPAERDHEEKCAVFMKEARRRHETEQSERARLLRETLRIAIRPRAASRTVLTSDEIDPMTWNRIVERFNRMHGRYPNVEETLALRRGYARRPY